MSLFDQLVDTALRTRADLATLRPVVEKELLHHDILREMSEAGLLAGLTFIGGTCLRACYGSQRLSEDLDFTGGRDFRKEDLAELARVLTDRLQTRYGLPVSVSEPVKTGGKVSTWKLTLETRPGQRHLPAQRIHLDICAISSHDPRPMMLRNLYGIDLGTSGLILQAQSREEILADKLIALAFRENRIKNRDLWDIGWLVQQGVELPAKLIPLKIRDHQHSDAEFATALQARTTALKTQPAYRDDFVKEMRRFLPATAIRDTVEKESWWSYLTQVIGEQAAKALKAIS
ncbi:MAG: nucleotidyl transferase AbiEii/AbiGii toxin family protein [Prosthecobacter sp.]|uniref:nucleotidyl transferase AbiEii/AbiGii toxin family protein n=1 Tax=Prosthecobacter sp. TaxID=1965333 RepID=UPI0019E72161|nr:nucleotidyl transferase AbiEii/AbiGii toxin family protein [Prosthecobacter sp.]